MTRNEAIAQSLSERIAAGEWELGDYLPSEPDLAAQYSVSRETLRASLKRLEDQGLIARRKGQGTRLVRRTPAQEFHTTLSSVEELAQYGRTAVRRIDSVDAVPAEPPIAAFLAIPDGTPVCRITSTRTDPGESGTALSYAEVFLGAEDAELIRDDLASSTRLVADLVAEKTGRVVDRVLQQIQATELDAAAARALGLPAGDIGLRLTRRYLDADGRPFVVAVSTHPGRTFVYESVLERR